MFYYSIHFNGRGGCVFEVNRTRGEKCNWHDAWNCTAPIRLLQHGQHGDAISAKLVGFSVCFHPERECLSSRWRGRVTLWYASMKITSKRGWWKEVTIKPLKTGLPQHHLPSPTSLPFSSQGLSIAPFSSVPFQHLKALIPCPSLLCLKPVPATAPCFAPPPSADVRILPLPSRPWVRQQGSPLGQLLPIPASLGRRGKRSLAGQRLRGGGLCRRTLPSWVAMNCVPRRASR